MTCQIYPIVQPSMSVRIFGRERWDLTELRRHFGVVGAGLLGTDLPGGRTAVTTGLDAVIAGFFSASTLWPNLHVTAEMRGRAAEALERIEASHLAAQLVGEMSAGEKRRILIARALVHRPRQLLLDEPSNALDLAAQRELRDTLRRLAAEGTGLVLVTHHLGDILPEIERVILMSAGRIVADGPRDQLLTAPRLSDLLTLRSASAATKSGCIVGRNRNQEQGRQSEECGQIGRFRCGPVRRNRSGFSVRSPRDRWPRETRHRNPAPFPDARCNAHRVREPRAWA